ncbi:MAG: hypothetical protein U0V48_01205 [Anaerolineales bacterium]
MVYASLIAVMPRSGGDYVWQTRIFGGGIGFILSITALRFTLWLWTPIYGDMLRQIVITPLLGAFGLQSAACGLQDKGTRCSFVPCSRSASWRWSSSSA